MKQKNWIFSSMVLALFVIACGGNHSHDDDAGHHGTAADTVMMHGQGMEYTSVYVCPMHCKGSGSDSAGTCPVCGMDYVKHQEHVKDGHRHSENR